MMLRTLLLATAAVAVIGSAPAWSQTITENLNNTGIPRNAPSLGLSNIYGLNPCAIGTSVGVTTPLFGLGGAVSDIDKQCETRNNAAVVVSALKDEPLAREILCEIKDIREAAIRIGKPCLQDQAAPRVSAADPPATPPAWSPAVAAAAPVRPAAAPPAPQPVATPAAVTVRDGAPAFCHVADLDLSLYPECTGAGPIPSAPRGSPAASLRPASRATVASVPAKPRSVRARADVQTASRPTPPAVAAQLEALKRDVLAHRRETLTRALAEETDDAARGMRLAALPADH